MNRFPRRLAVGLVILGAGALAGPAAAHHGALDPLFGFNPPPGGFVASGGGFTVADLTPGDDALTDVVGLSDGRIAAVGRVGGFAVTRFTAAGRLDTGFSGDGLRVIGAAGGEAHAVGTGFGLPVVAAGTVPLPTQPGDVALIRAFDASGGNLLSFGSASSIILSQGADVDTAALALAVDAPPPPAPNRPALSPLLAVGGTSGPGGPRDAWLAMVTPEGNLVGGSIATLPHFSGPTSTDRVNDIAFTADRGVVAVGASRLGIGNGVAFLHKRTPAGAVDAAFGGGTGAGPGTVTGQFGCEGSPGAEAHSVLVEPEGRIVVAGVCGGTGGTFFMVRLNADGSPDPTFRLANQTLTFPRLNEPVFDVVRRPDGSFVVVGSSESGGARRTMAIGLSKTGNLLAQGIPEFGTGGFQIAGPRDTKSSELAAVTTTADGNLVAAGRAVTKSGALLLVKYHAARDTARPRATLRSLRGGIDGVRDTGALRLRIGASEPVSISVRARLAGSNRVLARVDLPLASALTRTFTVPLTAYGRSALAGRSAARVRVTAVLEDVVDKRRTVVTTTTLR
jgi:uncharacterized delta-60 repeat protein